MTVITVDPENKDKDKGTTFKTTHYDVGHDITCRKLSQIQEAEQALLLTVAVADSGEGRGSACPPPVVISRA